MLEAVGAREGDDLPDVLGVAVRVVAGVDAAQAPPDDRDRRAVAAADPLDRGGQRGPDGGGRPDVAAEMPLVGVEALLCA